MSDTTIRYIDNPGEWILMGFTSVPDYAGHYYVDVIGGFWFADEIQMGVYGPYPTLEACKTGAKEYASTL